MVKTFLLNADREKELIEQIEDQAQDMCGQLLDSQAIEEMNAELPFSNEEEINKQQEDICDKETDEEYRPPSPVYGVDTPEEVAQDMRDELREIGEIDIISKTKSNKSESVDGSPSKRSTPDSEKRKRKLSEDSYSTDDPFPDVTDYEDLYPPRIDPGQQHFRFGPTNYPENVGREVLPEDLQDVIPFIPNVETEETWDKVGKGDVMHYGFDMFEPKTLDLTFRIPRLSNSKSVGHMEMDGPFTVPNVLTTDGTNIQVGFYNGIIRAFKPNNLEVIGSDLVIPGIEEFAESLKELHFGIFPGISIFLTDRHVYAYFHYQKQLKRVDNMDDEFGGYFNRLFKTPYGVFVISRLGWLYELQLSSAHVILLQHWQIVKSLECAEVISGNGFPGGSNEAIGFMMAVGDAGRIGFYRIHRTPLKGGLKIGRLLEVPLVDRYPMWMASSTQSLFVSTMLLNQSRDGYEILQIDWRSALMGTYAWRPYKGNGTTLNELTCENDNLIAILDDMTVVIFNPISMRKRFILALPKPPQKVRYLRGFIIYVTLDLYIQVKKLPKTSKLCPRLDCKKMFRNPNIYEGSNPYTVFCCRHYFIEELRKLSN